MISIPVAVNSKFYEWELDLFAFQMNHFYGDESDKHWIAALVNKANPGDAVNDEYSYASMYPHKMVKPYFDCDEKYSLDAHQIVPLNLQYALLQLLDNYEDDELIQLLDSDMFFMKKYPELTVGDDEVLVDTSYEPWHLHATTKNRHLIDPFLSKDHGDFNGGFIPIIANVRTWKKLLPDWISAHVEFFVDRHRTHRGSVEAWWAGMFTFSVACANNHIKMIPNDIMFTRGVTDSIIDDALIAHYCCDHIHIEKGGGGSNLFTKKRFEEIDQETKLYAYLEPFRKWKQSNMPLVESYMND